MAHKRFVPLIVLKILKMLTNSRVAKHFAIKLFRMPQVILLWLNLEKQLRFEVAIVQNFFELGP